MIAHMMIILNWTGLIINKTQLHTIMFQLHAACVTTLDQVLRPTGRKDKWVVNNS